LKEVASYSQQLAANGFQYTSWLKPLHWQPADCKRLLQAADFKQLAVYGCFTASKTPRSLSGGIVREGVRPGQFIAELPTEIYRGLFAERTCN
jgi:hypothetical protein